MLALEGVCSRYGRIEVIHGVTMRVAQGEIVALLGANGAGKTTLMRAISGVQPVSTGKIALDGADLAGVPAHRRVGRGILQVPEGRQIFAPLTVEENLLVGAWTRKDDYRPDIDRVWSTFPILAEFRHRPAGMLSGGQQQMLAIGRALMGRPRVLLLDEPSMGLSPLLIEQIFTIIATIRAQGVTVLVVEQNAQAALSIADRGYVLEAGAITLEGAGKSLLHDERVRDAYLGQHVGAG